MKHNTLLAALVIILLTVAFSATCQERVTIDSISFKTKLRADITARNERGEVFYLHYWYGENKSALKPGVVLLVTPLRGWMVRGYKRSKINIQ